jgi:hypothetical protein
MCTVLNCLESSPGPGLARTEIVLRFGLRIDLKPRGELDFRLEIELFGGFLGPRFRAHWTREFNLSNLEFKSSYWYLLLN